MSCVEREVLVHWVMLLLYEPAEVLGHSYISTDAKFKSET
jgi:hypothetical protein